MVPDFTIQGETGKAIWDANVGEELPCRRGLDNHQESFAIAVLILLVKVGE